MLSKRRSDGYEPGKQLLRKMKDERLLGLSDSQEKPLWVLGVAGPQGGNWLHRWWKSWGVKQEKARQLKCQQLQQALSLPRAEQIGQGKSSILGAQQPGLIWEELWGRNSLCGWGAGGTQPQPEVLLGTEPERNALGVSSPPSTRAAHWPNSPGNLGTLCVLCHGEGCQQRENEKGKSQSKPLNEAQMRIERSQANKPETPCRLELLHLTRNILKF